MADGYVYVDRPITRRQGRQLRRIARLARQPWALFEAVFVAVVAFATLAGITYVLSTGGF